MKPRILYVIAIFICSAGFIYGQDSIRTGQWLSANIHYGFILPAYTNGMDVLVKAHVPAIEIDYLNKSEGTRNWETDYHYAETGLAFFYAWLGNPAQLGNEIGAYPFINFHLQRSNEEAIYLRTGMGIGYFPVIFNQQTNHKDILIGSHLNTMINLRLTYHYYISNELRIETGFGITHCSDGSLITPNLGVNLITANTGLSYCIDGKKCSPLPHKADTSRHRKISHEIFVGLGSSELEPPGGPSYGAITLTYDAYLIQNKKNKLGAGIDLFYNGANLISMATDSIPVHSKIENLQVGAKAIYELTVGKIVLPFEFGLYMYTKSTNHGNEYNRIGIRYNINEHFIANISLLSHYAMADYVEWGLGYRI